MLHHLSLAVGDLGRAASFYDATLEALGYTRVWAYPNAVGYGRSGGEDEFAIKQKAGAIAPGEGFHVAFAAPSRDSVHAFHRAALANGGRDNGGAGLHPEYGSDYYAAFVFDPEGHRIEAVIKGGG